jgi:hypothetical protein
LPLENAYLPSLLREPQQFFAFLKLGSFPTELCEVASNSSDPNYLSIYISLPKAVFRGRWFKPQELVTIVCSGASQR